MIYGDCSWIEVGLVTSLLATEMLTQAGSTTKQLLSEGGKVNYACVCWIRTEAIVNTSQVTQLQGFLWLVAS